MRSLRLLAVVLLAAVLVVPVVPAVPAGAAPGPVAAAACWQHVFNDIGGDGIPDVTRFTLAFDCSSARFTFSIVSENTFPFMRFTDYIRFWASTPGGGGGCDGFDRMVAGEITLTGPVGTVFSTPSCDESTWVSVGNATFDPVDAKNFRLSFDVSDIGSASFQWFAEAPEPASGHLHDRMPNIGAYPATDVPYYPGATSGYWLTDKNGGVHSFGNAEFFGDLEGRSIAAPIVGMAAIPQRTGYWLLGADGGVFSYGAARFYGSTGGIRLNQQVFGIASTKSGHGYWFVASDGGIFSYGDAAFYGSTGALHLNQPIVGMAATPSGHGYWLVAADGGIFSFGDAAFYGSTGAIRLNRPIVGMAPTPSGHGYWLVASDGGVFSFGDVWFFGSTGHLVLVNVIVGMLPSPTGNGYRFASGDGGVFSFGDAPYYGSLFNSFVPHTVAIG